MDRHILIALVVTAFALSAGIVACGDDESTGDPPSSEGEAPAEGEASEEGARAQRDDAAARHREALAKTRVHLDLAATAHLADLDHGGLVIDFGTPARLHYTMGRWRGGWGADVTSGERDFTRMGADARVFFHLDERGPLTLRLRGRPVGSQAIVAYLNGERVGQIDFTGARVATHAVSVEASATRAGENTLMFRAAETRDVAGDPTAAEIDWLHISPGESAPADSPPRLRELVRSLEVGGESRDAIVLGSGARLRHYVEVPRDGKLALWLGRSGGESARARFTLTPEGGAPVELADLAAEPRWSPLLVDLGAHAGELARLEVSVEGEGEVGLAGASLVVPLPEPLAEARTESVIVLLIDTLRASKLKAYEPRSRVRTPALDAFAAEGAVFERAQSPENWTKPAVASILTSLTPMTHNTKEQSSRLPESALMISEVFQGEGFATAAFLANGYVSDRFGFHQGWDHYTNYIRENRRTEAEHVFREAIEWVEAHRDERFFLYIQTIDPHVPYDPPDDILRLYDPEPYEGRVRNRSTGILLEEVKRNPGALTARDIRRLEALHDGEITYHDREMVRFVERLGELGLYDRVLFVVTSDHGEEFNEHGSFGHGHSVYQELLHVPLMMRWPGTIQPRRIPETVSTLDIAPTLLEATGLAIPEVFEGRSLLGSARGVTRPGPAIAFSDKLDDRRVAVAAGYKLVVRGNLTWSFFDLNEDPGEQNQIDDGSRYPIAIRYLRGLLGQYLGASDRGDWLLDGGGTARALPQEDSQIDAELCAQLRAIGYIDARCEELN